MSFKMWRVRFLCLRNCCENNDLLAIFYPYLLKWIWINSTCIVWLGQVPFQVCSQLLQKVGNLAISECELQNEMFGDLGKIILCSKLSSRIWCSYQESKLGNKECFAVIEWSWGDVSHSSHSMRKTKGLRGYEDLQKYLHWVVVR